MRGWYAMFCAVMGYSPGNPNAIDRSATSTWFTSKNGNYCRFCDTNDIRLTVCRSRKTGVIGIVWNVGEESGWLGPYDSFEQAMDAADDRFFS